MKRFKFFKNIVHSIDRTEQAVQKGSDARVGGNFGFLGETKKTRKMTAGVLKVH